MNRFLDNLLNLPQVSVRNVLQESEEVFLILDCENEKVACPHCNHQTDEVNQTRLILVRDLPISGQPVQLKVPRRQFYCKNCQKYFTERLEFIDWGRNYTQRYEEHIYRRVNASSVEQVKREEDLSWDQVQGIYKRQCETRKKKSGVRSSD